MFIVNKSKNYGFYTPLVAFYTFSFFVAIFKIFKPNSKVQLSSLKKTTHGRGQTNNHPDRQTETTLYKDSRILTLKKDTNDKMKFINKK